MHQHQQVLVDTRQIHHVYRLLRESVFDLTDHIDQDILADINRTAGVIAHVRPPHNHDENNDHHLHVDLDMLVNCKNKLSHIYRDVSHLDNRHIHPAVLKIRDAYNIFHDIIQHH